MTQAVLKAQRQKTVNDLGLRPWFESYDETQLIFEMIRDEIARLPPGEKLRVLAQIDSLREEVAEMVKASA